MIDENLWEINEKGRSLAYFARSNRAVVNREMIEYLKEISNGKNSRFCLHRNINERLQDMIILAYKNQTCSRLHKHTLGKEAIHIMEGSALALVVNDEKELIDKTFLDADGNFAYRNDNGNYHNYFPLTKLIVMREIRDIENNPEETVFPKWDHIEVVTKYLKKEDLNCYNKDCKNKCRLYSL